MLCWWQGGWGAHILVHGVNLDGQGADVHDLVLLVDALLWTVMLIGELG